MKIEDLVDSAHERIDLSSLYQGLLIAGGAAVAVNTSLRFLAIWLFDAEGFEPLRFWPPIIATVIATLGAGALLLGASRLTRRPFLTFAVVASALAATSLVAPWQATDDAALAWSLTAMHLATAAIVIPVLSRYPRQYRTLPA